MSYREYRTLKVYQYAYKAAVEVHKFTADFPKPELYGGIADQIRRSTKGICANLAEGMGKGSSEAEEKRFLSIAMGSAEETRVWLDFSYDLGYISKEKADDYHARYIEIAKMLQGLINKRTT